MQENEDSEFFPDINEFLNNTTQNSDINIKNLEELIYIVRSKTGLTYEQCEILIKEIFMNMRNEILKGNKISIKSLGTFFISKNQRIFFNTPKGVKDKINGK